MHILVRWSERSRRTVLRSCPIAVHRGDFDWFGDRAQVGLPTNQPDGFQAFCFGRPPARRGCFCRQRCVRVGGDLWRMELKQTSRCVSAIGRPCCCRWRRGDRYRSDTSSILLIERSTPWFASLFFTPLMSFRPISFHVLPVNKSWRTWSVDNFGRSAQTLGLQTTRFYLHTQKR